MKLRLYLTFIKDLFAVLPSAVIPEWEEIESLPSNRPTVILVSGFAATQRSVSVMRKRLRKDGFNVVVVALDWQTLSDSVRGLYRMSEQLSSVAIRLRKEKHLSRSKIFIVAHSAGGLVARYYIQLLGGWHYCDRLVTLGTPHRGTWVAGLGFFTHLILKFACLFHMLPWSKFIQRINAATLPEGFRFVSISSRGDMLCYRKAAELPDTLKGHTDVESVEVGGLSHSGFLMSKRFYQVLRKHLNIESTGTGEFTATGEVRRPRL